MRAGNPNKYKGLAMAKETAELLTADPQRFASYCNGVGSKTGFWAKFLWHLLPNTIWFMSITDCSDIHDVEYSIPTNFATQREALLYKAAADKRFFQNLLKRISQRGGVFVTARKNKAWFYFETLTLFGLDSFMAGKSIGKTP